MKDGEESKKNIMIYRESNLNFYSPVIVSNRFPYHGLSYQHSPALSPKNTKLTKKRPYLVQNGVTHYNVFDIKQENPRDKTRTPLRFFSLHQNYLKKRAPKESNFLPKLKTLKLNLRSKSYYREKLVQSEKSSKDVNMGTDD